jgi:hypothetical protein
MFAMVFKCFSSVFASVSDVCCKYFSCSWHILHVFYLDVVKVDLDVAHVAMVIHVCFKCMFQIFQLFQTYVASVLSGCCICCSDYTHISQAYLPIVSSVSDIYWNKFFVLQVFRGSGRRRRQSRGRRRSPRAREKRGGRRRSPRSGAGTQQQAQVSRWAGRRASRQASRQASDRGQQTGRRSRPAATGVRLDIASSNL